MITDDPKNILLADDSLFFRTQLGEVIRDAGHNVQLVKDGGAAIDVIKDNVEGIDMLLLDLQMPVANGFKVLEWMKEESLTSKIPVVCLTGVYDPEEVGEVLEDLGAKALITKDISPEQTVECVNKILFAEKLSSARELDRTFVALPAKFVMGSGAHKGSLLNISPGGAFLHTPLKLKDGNMISLDFTLPNPENGEDLTINTRGEVKWTTSPDATDSRFSGAGIEFKRLTKVEKKLLDIFLKSAELKFYNA
jgi:CheY-like chemotaxis protein